jgi:tryptophan 2,3-dioxygenase
MVNDVGLKVIRKELKAAIEHLKMGKIELVFKAINPSYFNRNGQFKAIKPSYFNKG